MARGNFGERLKRERELREVTLQEITSATRIGPRFLEALENEDWEKLPGGVFNRGFVRSIARYLGLDEEVMLGDYDMALGAQVPAAEENPEEKKSPQSRWKPALIALFLIALLGGAVYAGIVAWKYYTGRRILKQALPAALEASPSLVPQPVSTVLPKADEHATAKPSLPASSASGPLDLRVSARAATHLLVLADGRVAFYDEVRAGQDLRFSADYGFEVTVADSGTVLLELNGQAMPPLGPPGSSGTMKLSNDDLRQVYGGNAKP
jgi:cytoskeleton protein RodZ